MKIVLNTEKCISCGTCWAICPRFFAESQEGKSHLKESEKQGANEVKQAKAVGCCKEAAEACPAGAIAITN